jgi:DNA-binding winged helix-turn-helix (wHTH) protein/Tol biopolymer transport system component
MPDLRDDNQPRGRRLLFGCFAANPRSGELRKQGVRVPLQPRPFQALLLLLEHANEVVTREELRKHLWTSDTFVDFDHGLNTAIRKVRFALNDDAEQPRFIETVGRLGYRFLVPVEIQDTSLQPPIPQVPISSENPAPDALRASPDVIESKAIDGSTASPAEKAAGWRAGWGLWARAGAAALLLLIYWFRPATPAPRVSQVVQLTKSGGARPEDPLFTDGPRVYYQSIGPLSAEWQLRQVLANGSQDAAAGVPADRFRIRGLSPDDTEFLALSRVGGESGVWTVPVSSGSPRRIGNLMADDIAWAHEGNWFAYARANQLFLSKPDAASSRLLATVPDASGQIEHIRWSPDDRRLRFTVTSSIATLSAPPIQALWEVAVDGGNLHELHFPWSGKAVECCGEWTQDGHYYVFASSRQGISNLWALEEKPHWWQRANRDPVQLTFGPVNYYQPIPSRNGESIFAIGVQPEGELVRYDAKREEFVPYLDGRSLAHLSFSRDGQWMAYVTFPEGTLWRARIDGSEPLQLTFPPFQVGSPRWSPDGTQIAYHAIQPGQLWKAYTIPAEGGNPEPFPPEPSCVAQAGWMPGRDALTYSHAYGAENPAIYIFDRHSGHSEKMPGTDGLYGPIWSPDGRYLTAVNYAAGDKLMLFDRKSGKWTQIAGQAAWQTWSPDSQYIYFVRWGIDWIFRVHVPDGREEKVLLVPFRLTFWPFTVAPDGSLILLREHGRYDVYSLSLSTP